MKNWLKTAAAVSAFALPSAAAAQDRAPQPFVGVSAGYHTVDIDDGPLDLDNDDFIIGAVAGVDFPVGEAVFLGVEGNYHFGLDALDSEYGGSARLGVIAPGGAKYYVRGGYQEVDVDVEGFTDIDLPDDLLDDLDTSDGDYMVGIGAEFYRNNAAIRVNVDTISFDSLRLTTGLVFGF